MKHKLSVQHCAFAWLVEHAAWVHAVRMRQSDGITAYQRLRGVDFRLKMICFGESCLYKIPKKKPETALEGKLGSKWKDGVFLGYSRDSNEYVVWSTEGKTIARSRSLQRKPESERWRHESLAEVSQRPQDALYRATAAPAGRREPHQDLGERLAVEDEAPQTRAGSAHDLRVTVEDLQNFGFTEIGCQRCDFIH